MEKKKQNNKFQNNTIYDIENGYRKDMPGAISGINTPGIDLPAFNPPVPNRAWTAMRKDYELLSEEEKRDRFMPDVKGH